VKKLQLYMNALYCFRPIFVWNEIINNSGTFHPVDEASAVQPLAGIVTLIGLLLYQTQRVEGSWPATKSRRNEDMNVHINVRYNVNVCHCRVL
jgi:hypothetical protein